mgnify:CR=1 FL=1
MKKPLFLVPFAALALSACGYSVFDAADDIQSSDSGFAGGKSITGSAATTAAFTKLESSGPDNIVFVTGDSFSIKAEGDADAIAKLRYKIEDGAIMIGREKGKYWGKDSKGVTITVTAPALAEASLAGSGDFTADKMTGDKMVLEIAGSGSVSVADVIGIPVIASGVVGGRQHRANGITSGHADAVLAASIFHYGQHTVGEAKRFMAQQGIPMRLA